MTNAQLPKGVDAAIKQLRLCVDQLRHIRKTKNRSFNEEERDAWKWLDDMMDVPVIAAQFAELDRDTNDYINDLLAQVAEAIHPEEKQAVAGPTLFDGLSEDAA